MNRRKFLKNAGFAAGAMAITNDMFAGKNDPIYGHNDMHYRINVKWGVLNPEKHPVNDCHEMIQDKKGRIVFRIRPFYVWRGRRDSNPRPLA